MAFDHFMCLEWSGQWIYDRRYQAALVVSILAFTNAGTQARSSGLLFLRLAIETCRFQTVVLLPCTIQSTYFMLKLTTHVLKGYTIHTQYIIHYVICCASVIVICIWMYEHYIRDLRIGFHIIVWYKYIRVYPLRSWHQ